MQTWSLSHLQKLLLNTLKNLFPISFIYVQLPNEKSLTEIWPCMIWKDITSAYDAVFFRAEGGGSAAFGEKQNENSLRLTSVISGRDNNEIVNANTSLAAGGTSKHIFTGRDCSCEITRTLSFEISGGEVRPRNMAIRIWKKPDNLLLT